MVGHVRRNSQEPSPPLEMSDMLGQFFFMDAGSSGGTFMLTTGVRIKSRNTVEVSCLRPWMTWSDSSVVAINPDGEKVEPNTFIINCKEKTYTPDSYATDGYRTKTFFSGTAYKWDDYSAGDFIVSIDRDRMTTYMRNVCNFTGDF